MATGTLRNLNRRVFGLRWSCSVQILRVRTQVSYDPQSREFSVHRFIHVTTKPTTILARLWSTHAKVCYWKLPEKIKRKMNQRQSNHLIMRTRKEWVKFWNTLVMARKYCDEKSSLKYKTNNNNHGYHQSSPFK